jgi:hypothetical protein
MVRRYNKDLAAVRQSTGSVPDSLDSGYSSSQAQASPMVGLGLNLVNDSHDGRSPSKRLWQQPAPHSIRVCRVDREPTGQDTSRSLSNGESSIAGPPNGGYRIVEDPLCLPGPVVRRITASKGTDREGGSCGSGTEYIERFGNQGSTMNSQEYLASGTARPLLQLVPVEVPSGRQPPSSPTWQPLIREQDGRERVQYQWPLAEKGGDTQRTSLEGS